MTYNNNTSNLVITNDNNDKNDNNLYENITTIPALNSPSAILLYVPHLQPSNIPVEHTTHNDIPFSVPSTSTSSSTSTLHRSHQGHSARSEVEVEISDTSDDSGDGHCITSSSTSYPSNYHVVIVDDVNVHDDGGDDDDGGGDDDFHDENRNSSKKSKQPIAPFILKLRDILSVDHEYEYRDIIRWHANGGSFLIAKPSKFSSLIAPIYFKLRNFQSFVRQLNSYGFSKVRSDLHLSPSSSPTSSPHRNDNMMYCDHRSGSGGEVLEFRHPFFNRADADLARKIKRKSRIPVSTRSHVISPEKAEISRFLNKISWKEKENASHGHHVGGILSGGSASSHPPSFPHSSYNQKHPQDLYFVHSPYSSSSPNSSSPTTMYTNNHHHHHQHNDEIHVHGGNHSHVSSSPIKSPILSSKSVHPQIQSSPIFPQIGTPIVAIISPPIPLHSNLKIQHNDNHHHHHDHHSHSSSPHSSSSPSVPILPSIQSFLSNRQTSYHDAVIIPSSSFPITSSSSSSSSSPSYSLPPQYYHPPPPHYHQSQSSLISSSSSTALPLPLYSSSHLQNDDHRLENSNSKKQPQFLSSASSATTMSSFPSFISSFSSPPSSHSHLHSPPLSSSPSLIDRPHLLSNQISPTHSYHPSPLPSLSGENLHLNNNNNTNNCYDDHKSIPQSQPRHYHDQSNEQQRLPSPSELLKLFH